MAIFPRNIFPTLLQALEDTRIIVITGMRRVGKTTTVRWLFEQIPSQNKIYLDLERQDYRSIFQERNYDLVLGYLRNQGLDIYSPLTVALDEIQNVPNLPSVIKYLYDAHHFKFILTGSSSYYLKNLFSESMAGRKVVYELFPLAFGEFLHFKGVPFRERTGFAEMLFDSYEYDRLKDYYTEFLTFGGLPDVVLEPRTEPKIEILKDIYSSYINIDVRTMADFQKISELQQLLKVLASRIGNKVDHSKLATIVGLSRPTLLQYLEFLEKTYILYRLPAFTNCPDRAVALGKKLYFCDNGIAHILDRQSEGALFENGLFNQLRRYGELAYLSKGHQYEVDFIVTDRRNGESTCVGLEAKVHPLPGDQVRLNRIGERNELQQTYLVGREPVPGFTHFVWGGLVF
ncbi:MAG: ATP-binding protein [Anaerolineaceae bacterium]|nr:ATP-binding protein [Anaerolineaceae bacterium]